MENEQYKSRRGIYLALIILFVIAILNVHIESYTSQEVITKDLGYTGWGSTDEGVLLDGTLRYDIISELEKTK
jgi:hypothetical protein